MKLSALSGFTRASISFGGLATAGLLVVAWLLGGASRQHELRLALVELAALPLLGWSVTALIRTGDWQRHRFALLILASVAALPLLQLAPLPPQVWPQLPGRQDPALALELLGIRPGWAGLSLTPDRTWRSLLALLPAVAMFIGVLALPGRDRFNLVRLLLALTGLAILLAAAQMASGSEALYLWATTGAGSAVGTFANRNHMATLCLLAIPLAAIMGGRSMRRSQGSAGLWFSSLFIGLTFVALAIIKSRAGIILAGPTLCASIAAAWIAAGRGRPRPGLMVLIAAAGIALAGIGAFALNPIIERFQTTNESESRFTNWPFIVEAAEAYLPFGSGIGSFDAVFRSVEPVETLDPTFFNQAHNDYLETWLETGWLGIAILIAFLVWFVRRTGAAWRAPPTTDHDLQRAASIGVAVILLHSAGDYPLRTAAMATILAILCGILEFAGQVDLRGVRERRRSRRHRTDRPS